MFNYEIAIQLITDFIESEDLPDFVRKARKQVGINLLIDLYSRSGELFQYKENFPEAIKFFKDCLDLINDNQDGNERQMIATTFSIGYCLEMIKSYDEANLIYTRSVDMLKKFIALKICKITGK